MRINVTQKPMSFRIDLDLITPLDVYCKARGIKKNRAINEAIEKMLSDTL